MNTQENSTPLPPEATKPEGESLLSEILATEPVTEEAIAASSVLSSSPVVETPSVANVSDLPLTEGTPPTESVVVPVPEKPKKQPLKPAEFLRIVGAAMLVALIFFGAFLAYIVFNPEQAQFFITFRINPADIASVLQKLVNVIFGIIIFLLSISWIVFLFRAILTKKEFKKKKTIAIILSVFNGVILFSGITLWAFLIQKINATDYQNPNGGVIVYDNEKFLSEKLKNQAQLQSFDNLIGPLELRFDLKADANLVAKSVDIEDYEIDFDGAKCKWTDSSIVKGINPAEDQTIICTFDSKKSYKPNGVYHGTDRVTRKPKDIIIAFPAMNIAGVVNIKKPKTKQDHTITYDASSLSNLGTISWYTERSGTDPASHESAYSLSMTKEEQVICLGVFAKNDCDRYFVVPSESSAITRGKIAYEADSNDPLSYSFHVEGAKMPSGEIVNYKWTLDGDTVISTEDSFVHKFPEYRTYRVTLTMTDSAGNTLPISEKISIDKPVDVVRSGNSNSILKITDEKGDSILTHDMYDVSRGAYVLSRLPTPTKFTFDATDVSVGNAGYQLQDVEWDFDDGKGFQKKSKTAEYEFIEERRYTVQARYTFLDKQTGTNKQVDDKIIIETKKQDIALALNISQDSEYVPVTLHVDGSATKLKEGEITKFMYDFGEGKGAVEGDAVQDYRYTNPGEYTLTFTVVKSDGTKESTSRKIVVKDQPKRLIVNSSVSSGIVNHPIDFDTNGTAGKIDTYQWDFGDGLGSTEATPSHVYAQAGKYTVKLMAVYADKTIGRMEKDIEVRAE